MAITDRRLREKEQRKTEIIDAAERLFFSGRYEDVSMDEIARTVELNKATLYLYFENKEALFATIVLRGVRILEEKFRKCSKREAPGIVRVALMGQAYYRFSQEYPEYLRLIHFYGSERFSEENPYTAGIGKGYGTCRSLLQDAIREGIEDKTIRNDIDPFLASMYLMISFMGILSMENKWKLVIAAEGFSNEQFTHEFFRFILPALSPAENSHRMDMKDFAAYGFSFTEPVAPAKKKRKRS
ncbi:MAG: TetR/AcrR family transcriptional regulator [Methanomicrobiales archaeon HGW-Methanomicrobiales-3]|jgi:AcrR family transcriptional regulator|nr:MAG: TetR/AcrR family transcriptional regulator [Methanomicrobiales archaeon HGW-Methanomicrobiales-3]